MAIKSDADWVRKSFMVPTRVVVGADAVRREMTEAAYKFTDTTLGGNFAINPPPQYCRRADLPVVGRFVGDNTSGQGRYYSEAIDDRGQLIHLRFGVPKFNGLTNFFANFYNPEAASLANKGRAPSSFYQVGQAIGFVVTIPLLPIIWAGQIFRFLTSKPASRYYYLKPAMPLYWSAVTSMVNAIGVNMGVIGRITSPGEEAIRNEFDPVDRTELEKLKAAMVSAKPYTYNPDGSIDIYKMATKAQRLARLNRNNIAKFLESTSDFNDLALDSTGSSKFRTEMTKRIQDPGSKGIGEYVRLYHESNSNSPQEEGESASKDSDPVDSTFTDMADVSFSEFMMAELEDGSAFVTFRVDETGDSTESFSNNTGQSAIAGKINGMSSSARSARFDLMDGNVGAGVFGSLIGGAINASKDLLTGALDQVGMSGLAALGGSGFVDIPEVWENSTANLPSMSYTIELRSPYGNPMSRFQNLVVPLSMLLAGALPLSTGKQSYTSPFLVEVYSKGKNQCRMGIIDSITITRGVGNLGWTRNGEALGIDISFSIKDLSSVMHMPIKANFSATDAAVMSGASAIGAGVGAVGSTLGLGTVEGGAAAGENVGSLLSMSNFDDDNAFSDYLAVLGSLSLADQIYPTNKLRLRRALRMAEFNKWKSPAYYSNWMVGTDLGQFVTAVTRATERGQ